MHSRLRKPILKQDGIAARKTGLTCYRIAVSTEDAKKALGDLPLPHWWEPSTCNNRSSLLFAGDGTGRVVTCYPLRNQTYFNISCIMKKPDSDKSTASTWHADGDRDEMVKHFGDYNESLKRILS